jgi:hypothetical protein
MFSPLSSTTPHLVNRILILLRQRAHNAWFSVDGRQHDGHIHNFFLRPLPPIGPGDKRQWFEGCVPVPLAQLHVLEGERVQYALVREDKGRDLTAIHDSILEFHFPQAGELERGRASVLVAHTRMRHFLAGNREGKHTRFPIQTQRTRTPLPFPAEEQPRQPSTQCRKIRVQDPQMLLTLFPLPGTRAGEGDTLHTHRQPAYLSPSPRATRRAAEAVQGVKI